ncbi:MAG TPA: hypothetical protein VFP59_20205 [Candidatus Angelobacter sp.]|nr:hypothetical protein [Candidatus Angelobacter sp.]
MMYRIFSRFLPILAILFLSICGFAQSLPDVSSVKDLPSTTPVSPRYERLKPLSIHRQPDFLNSATVATLGANEQSATPFSLAHVISVANFQGSFSSRGKTWPFTMIGAPPSGGATINVPAKIVAVSLKLQNADLVTFTTVSVAGFKTPALNSPNFHAANYSSGSTIQFADAVQRAEFFHTMKSTWHTALKPATIVQSLTMNVPRFTTITLNGKKTQVRTYFTSKSTDGHTVIFLLDQFFNQAISNLGINQINAGRFTTNAINIVLFPNTFLYSVNSTGGMGACCVLGFHTFFTNNARPTESRWVFAFASWISPGVFGGGLRDVTALSHEISEALDDPFLNNLVPAWQIPNQPGSCQDDLEVGDPVEVLSNAVFPVKIGATTYHPQTEALLQWFEQKTTSNAINGAFSYPNTKALTKSATAFGPLTCP